MAIAASSSAIASIRSRGVQASLADRTSATNPRTLSSIMGIKLTSPTDRTRGKNPLLTRDLSDSLATGPEFITVRSDMLPQAEGPFGLHRVRTSGPTTI